MLYIKRELINLLNVVLSVATLILECLPNSVIKAIRIDGGYIISYHSYFANPSDWNVTLMIAFIMAMISIISLIFNIVLLIKKSKAIYITSTVLLSFTSLISLITLTTDFSTEYNILIMTLFFIQLSIKIIVKLEKNKQNTDARIRVINYLNIFLIITIMSLECAPNSVQIVQKYNFGHVSEIIGNGFSYFFYSGDNWLSFIELIVAILTICILLLGFFTQSKDIKSVSMTALVLSTVCFACNLVSCIMAGSQVTAYNVIITVLFCIPIITYSIKLKTFYNAIDKRLT